GCRDRCPRRRGRNEAQAQEEGQASRESPCRDDGTEPPAHAPQRHGPPFGPGRHLRRRVRYFGANAPRTFRSESGPAASAGSSRIVIYRGWDRTGVTFGSSHRIAATVTPVVSHVQLDPGGLETMFTLRALSSAASLLLLTSCALEVGDPQTEPLGTATAEIKNGNVGWHPGVVALYYGGVRPCSGVYMGSGANGYVWVLTARHCVTTDGSLQGPLLSPSAIWATAQDNPGLTAPSLAVRYAYSYWQRVVEIRQIHPTVDLAMLRLQAPLDYLAPSGNTMPVYPSNVSNTPTSSFMDKELQCAGYGRAFNLSLPLGQENGTTGAGRARWARLTVEIGRAHV